MKLNMFVYFRAKFEAFSIILVIFRKGCVGCVCECSSGGGGYLPQNEHLKSPPRLGLNELCGKYVWILKGVNLHFNWINLINVLNFPKQLAADLYSDIQNPVKHLSWSVYQKKLLAFSHCQLLENTPS